MGDLPGLPAPQSTDATTHSAVDVPSDSSARAAIRLKDYEIKGAVGEGGIGVVYRARHLVSNKPATIKVLHEYCGRQKDLVEKLFVEAKAASRIHHPNITDVTDFGMAADGSVFVATDYLDGESLEDRLRRVHRLPLFDAINIVKQVAHGLGAAHELGIVHRDLKPANIFLCSRESHRRIVRRSKETGMRFTIVPEKTFDLVKLLDFGASSFIDFDPSAQTPAEVVCRTPYYLSPEQTQGRPTDQRCDIYALGAIFYQMVTGTLPVGGETVPAIVDALAKGSVIAPSRRTPEAGTSLRIDSLILKCLNKNPSLRFASTAELCTALDECLGDCAYLRDAHRLPGIQFSDIDLSQASLEARQNAAPATPETPTTSATPAEPKPPTEPIAKAAKSAPQTIAWGTVLHEARATEARATEARATSWRVPRPVAQSVPKKTEAKRETQVDEQVDGTGEKQGAKNSAQPDAQKVIVVSGAPAQAESTMAATPAIVATPVLERHERSLAPGLIAIGGVLLVGLVVIAFWPATPASTPAAPERPAAIAPAAVPGPPAPSAPAPAAAAPVPAVPAVPTVPAVPAPAPAAVAPETPPAPAIPAPAPAVVAPETPPARAVRAATPQAKAASSASHRGHHKKERGAVAVKSRGSDEASSGAAESPATAEAAARPETEPASTADPFEPGEPEASEGSKGSRTGSAVSVEDRLREAQRASRTGHHKSAIRKARAVLKADPKPGQVMQAYQVIATSSCALGKIAAVRDAATHLDKRALATVRAACKKDGVTIE